MDGGRQRINGETITGMALVLLASVFIWAGSQNPVWAIILTADYLILAIGIGFIAIGVVAINRTNHPSTTHSRY